jgi:phosphatidylinositol dimannoside acyltransferase
MARSQASPSRATQPVTDEPSRARSTTAPSAPDRDGERARERLIHWGYLAAERLISALPRGLVLPVAAAAGNAAYDLSRAKVAIVCDNLSRPMQLPADDPRVRLAARRAFRSYGKYLADVMRMPALTPEVVDRLVTIDNIEVLDEARSGGTGVLVCTVHIGGMDLIGPAMLRHGESLHVVADDTTYGRLYEHLKSVRAEHGLLLIGWRNLRGIFRVLRNRESVVLFCDVGFRRGDVPVEFLGEATTFPAGPASLSARTGAPMLPVYCQRTGDERFRARGLPTIRCSSTEPREVQRATQALADALSEVIRVDPSQWYMFRPVWPQTDADRAWARGALDAARRGQDWGAKPA